MNPAPLLEAIFFEHSQCLRGRCLGIIFLSSAAFTDLTWESSSRRLYQEILLHAGGQ